MNSTTPTILLEGQQLGSKRPLFPQYHLPIPPSWLQPAQTTTLRDLIGRLVAHELDAFQQRQAERQLFRVLTKRQIQAGKTAGRIDPAAKQPRPTTTLSEAQKTAYQAFEDGLFFVFVDEEQKESLDDPILLTAASKVRFIRLVALAGG